ncbi:MAG: DoxX family protein [Deltaproteobacteria bacterium]|nr:MAG: DoxX family protein [Deltaproteobacteria bacterium]
MFPTFFNFARFILGIIFIYASYDKILHTEAFAQIVYNYQLIPDALINITAIFLPWLEFVTGVVLIIGLWLPGSVVITNFLLVSYLGALLFNMARGLDINCGCFSSTIGESTTQIWPVFRDISFLFLSIYLFFSCFPPANNPNWRKMNITLTDL